MTHLVIYFICRGAVCDDALPPRRLGLALPDRRSAREGFVMHTSCIDSKDPVNGNLVVETVAYLVLEC